MATGGGRTIEEERAYYADVPVYSSLNNADTSKLARVGNTIYEYNRGADAGNWTAIRTSPEGTFPTATGTATDDTSIGSLLSSLLDSGGATDGLLKTGGITDPNYRSLGEYLVGPTYTGPTTADEYIMQRAGGPAWDYTYPLNLGAGTYGYGTGTGTGTGNTLADIITSILDTTTDTTTDATTDTTDTTTTTTPRDDKSSTVPWLDPEGSEGENGRQSSRDAAIEAANDARMRTALENQMDTAYVAQTEYNQPIMTTTAFNKQNQMANLVAANEEAARVRAVAQAQAESAAQAQAAQAQARAVIAAASGRDIGGPSERELNAAMEVMSQVDTFGNAGGLLSDWGAENTGTDPNTGFAEHQAGYASSRF